MLDRADPLEPDDDDVLRAALELAVLWTIDTESPEVGDEVALQISGLDSEYGDAVEELEFLGLLGELTSTDVSLGGWASAAWDVLGGWLRTARRDEDPATVAEGVLRWVAERLGRSGPALEQQAILLGGPGAPRPLDVGRCLLEDVTAVRVWLVAGLVAVTRTAAPAGLVDPRRAGHGVTPAPTRRRGAVSSGDSVIARVSAETVGPER